MIATHDVEFAATFADRVILLARGEVAADGTARRAALRRLVLLERGGAHPRRRRGDGRGGRLGPGAGVPAAAAPQRPPRRDRMSWEAGVMAMLGSDAARRLRLVRALPPALADRRPGGRARRDLGRGAGGLLADPERRPDHRHHADRRLHARRCAGLRGRSALRAGLQLLARSGAVDSLADGGLGADRDPRRRRGGGERPEDRPVRARGDLRASRASPTVRCSTSR